MLCYGSHSLTCALASRSMCTHELYFDVNSSGRNTFTLWKWSAIFSAYVHSEHGLPSGLVYFLATWDGGKGWWEQLRPCTRWAKFELDQIQANSIQLKPTRAKWVAKQYPTASKLKTWLELAWAGSTNWPRLYGCTVAWAQQLTSRA